MLVATVTAPSLPGLGDDLRLPLVLLRVQHLVRDAALLAAARDSCSDFSTEIVPTSTGWPLLVALGDVVDRGVELRVLGLVDVGRRCRARTIGRFVGIDTT